MLFISGYDIIIVCAGNFSTKKLKSAKARHAGIHNQTTGKEKQEMKTRKILAALSAAAMAVTATACASSSTSSNAGSDKEYTIGICAMLGACFAGCFYSSFSTTLWTQLPRASRTF